MSLYDGSLKNESEKSNARFIALDKDLAKPGIKRGQLDESECIQLSRLTPFRTFNLEPMHAKIALQFYNKYRHEGIYAINQHKNEILHLCNETKSLKGIDEYQVVLYLELLFQIGTGR